METVEALAHTLAPIPKQVTGADQIKGSPSGQGPRVKAHIKRIDLVQLNCLRAVHANEVADGIAHNFALDTNRLRARHKVFDAQNLWHANRRVTGHSDFTLCAAGVRVGHAATEPIQVHRWLRGLTKAGGCNLNLEVEVEWVSVLLLDDELLVGSDLRRVLEQDGFVEGQRAMVNSWE